MGGVVAKLVYVQNRMCFGWIKTIRMTRNQYEPIEHGDVFHDNALPESIHLAKDGVCVPSAVKL